MKKIALGLATCGLILSSCSSNDVFEDNQGTNNPNVINFSATTTRATVNNLVSLQNDQNGFGVYATSGANSENWYITAQTYKYENSAWNWVGESATKNWPIATNGYPMNFYAMFPKESVAGKYEITPTVGAPTATITIEEDPADQTDFLAANYLNVTTKPASGKLNLMFQHITSKVNFSVIAGIGAGVFVQQLHMQNVGNAGTFKYKEQTWNEFTTDEVSKGDYQYFPIDKVVAGDKELTPFNPTIPTTIETKYPVYATGTDRNMMLRPQTETATWTGQIADATAGDDELTIDKAYIESVYRIEANGDENAVGYKNAYNHPGHENYPKKPGDADFKEYTYNGPLFVKVGFPLGATLTWMQGRAYNYNIKLGTVDASGGIIIDDFYYDNKGNRTNLPIIDKEPGDPVNDGEIHFDVTVEGWGGETELPIDPAPAQ